MQMSGLKSITVKHLAFCSQSVLFLIDSHPSVKGSPQVERILQPEFDRLKQTCSKKSTLLQRVRVNATGSAGAFGWHAFQADLHHDGKSLGWNREAQRRSGKSRAFKELDSCPPSQAIKQIAKQLRILTQVLTPVLHEEQMVEICTKAAEIFSEELGSAFLEMIHEFGIC